MTTLNDTNRSAWQPARSACKSIEDREALGKVIAAGWSAEELTEFARICFFRNGKDYPTPRSYREAVHKVAIDLQWREISDTYEGVSRRWRKHFHLHGSVPIPPRDVATLKRFDKYPIDVESYFWPYHSPEHRAEIDALARAYYKIAENVPVPPWAWEISRSAVAAETDCTSEA